MSPVAIYLIAINVLAFVIYTIDYQLYQHGGDGIKPEVICNLVTMLGGSLGTCIAEFLWDRKINKVNAQSRIYTIFWLILHVLLVFALFGPNSDMVKQKAIEFYESHKILCLYLAVINIATFIVFAVDKVKAIRQKWRIREIVLLGLALIGGSVGGLLAMDICNHKVTKMHFMIGIPLMMIAHILILVAIGIGII